MIILLIIASLTNCDRPSAQENREQGTSAQLGIIQEYSDTPGLAKTEIRNAADRIVTTGYYLNGLKESSWVDYTPGDGIVTRITSYVRGKKEGVFLEFNPGTQQLIRHSFFHNDLLHGEYREFSGGVLKETRHYENGKLEGVSKLFYETGLVMEEGYYKHGLRDGVSKWYDQQGKMTIQYEYQNGELVKK
jgi:antitoxin component YwqK of YwqJK toxin-antitoxin module